MSRQEEVSFTSFVHTGNTNNSWGGAGSGGTSGVAPGGSAPANTPAGISSNSNSNNTGNNYYHYTTTGTSAFSKAGSTTGLDGGGGGVPVAPATAAAAGPAAVTQYGSYGSQASYLSYQPARQASSISQTSSQSAYQRPPPQRCQPTTQQQQPNQPLGPQAAAQLAAPDPQSQPAVNHGSVLKPSPSGNSLLQYDTQQQQQPGGPASAATRGSMSQSQSQGSLLMTGPGSLCAGLPRYVRRPPIEAVVFGWGVSEDGQLGLADVSGDVAAPKVVEALLGVQFSGRGFCRTPLVAGSRNTLTLDAAGQVWSFGWNDRGTLGHGHRSKERKPQRIAALKGIRIVQVAIGGWHCLALSDRGTMFAWGGNEYGQCGSVVPGQRDIVEPLPVDLGMGPTHRVRQVAAGGMHSLALLEDGTVWQWGENWGDFSMHAAVRTPRPVPGAVAVAAVCCGAFHNLLLTAGGRVLSWGMNDYGQLGNGSLTYSTAPRPVVDMDGVVVADIAAGGWHSCALSSAGEVYVWGRGEYGRLGLGDRSGSSKLRPQKVRGLESHVVVQVAAGGSHTMALTASARLFVWGRGAFGRLGLGGGGNSGGAGEGNRDCYHPVEAGLPGGTERWRVAAIGAGGRHSMCLAIPVRDPVGYPVSSPDLLSGEEGEGQGDLAALLPFRPAPGPGQHPRRGSSGDDLDLEDLEEGYSEPSLFDKDLSFDQGPSVGASPQRTRRHTAASGVVIVSGDGGGGASASAVQAGDDVTAAGGGDVADDGPVPAAAAGRAADGPDGVSTTWSRVPPPDLYPNLPADSQANSPSLEAPPPITALAPPPPPSAPSSPTLSESGAAANPLPVTSALSVNMVPLPPLNVVAPPSAADSQDPTPPSRGTRGSGDSANSGRSSGGVPPSPPPSLESAASGVATTPTATAAAQPPSPAFGRLQRPSSSLGFVRSASSYQPPYQQLQAMTVTGPGAAAAGFAGGGSSSGGGAAAGGMVSPTEPRSPGSPSGRPPSQALAPLPPAPAAVSYSMRRVGSAVGPLSQLARILPEPAAVAAAALLDADSDMAQPRGLAAATAAAAAVAAAVGGAAVSGGASRPSSAHGSGGAVSRGGSVTGMRFRTVFGGGGEEEDEAVQAAEAAEAAAEELSGSGTGEEDLGVDPDNDQDDTDEDPQGMYDTSGAVQHPRSPSLMQRPRSPPMPLSPHRRPSTNAGSIGAGGGTGGGVGGGPHRVLSPSPSSGHGAAVAGAALAGGAAAGSPSSRAFLASYGSPRVPSSLAQQ